MPIVDSQIHLWENARMSPQHRQIPTYSVDDALKEMAEAGVDAAVIHPPSTLGKFPLEQRKSARRTAWRRR
jgi:predicted TIM-barrel fold metal-dependent hydrolase